MEKINQLVLHHSGGTSTFQIEDSSKVAFDEAQTLTRTQKEQARENIGAVGVGEGLNLHGNDIEEVGCLLFVSGDDDTTLLNVSGYFEDADPEKPVLAFEGHHDIAPVALRNLADGRQATDAATLGQLQRATVGNPPATHIPALPVGTVVDTFQADTKFAPLTLGSYTASANADTEDFLLGSQSLHFVNCIQANNLNLPMTGKQLRLRFKINSIADGANFTMYLADSSSFSKYISFNLFSADTSEVNRSIKLGQWTDLVVPLGASMTDADTIESLTTVNTIRFRFTDGGGTGDANIQMVMLQDVDAKESKGIVSFTFDDGLVTQYTQAARILGARGIPATAYIIPSLVGVSDGCMTEAQIQALKTDYGWDIESHWGDDMTHMSEDELAREFAAVKTWIQERGLGRGDHFAYPGGAHNDTVEKVARQYFSTARTIDYTTLGGIKSTLITEPHRLNAISAIGDNPSGYSIAKVKETIDRVAKFGGWAILVFHSIGDTATAMYCKADHLAEIADYAVASGVQIKTVADVLA